MAPRDALRKRVFVQPLGLKVEIEAGAVELVVYDQTERTVTMNVTGSATARGVVAERTVVWLYAPGQASQGFSVQGATGVERGGWVVEIGEEGTEVVIR